MENNNSKRSGWVNTTLGEFATHVTSGLRNWLKYYAEKGALFIRTQDLKENKLAINVSVTATTGRN